MSDIRKTSSSTHSVIARETTHVALTTLRHLAASSPRHPTTRACAVLCQSRASYAWTQTLSPTYGFAYFLHSLPPTLTQPPIHPRLQSGTEQYRETLKDEQNTAYRLAGIRKLVAGEELANRLGELRGQVADIEEHQGRPTKRPDEVREDAMSRRY